MTSRRVYRMSDDYEPERGAVNGIAIAAVFWLIVGYVLGRYL